MGSGVDRKLSASEDDIIIGLFFFYHIIISSSLEIKFSVKQ